ncbi:MAG: ADP compounds hydrolase NudE [Methylococcales bacterium]|nr:ADP compounds hydrolase NudE [Methylococcales bacterium]
MPTKPTIVAKRLVAQSQLFSIEALDLRFANGQTRTYERLSRGRSHGAVLVVAMPDAAHVLLVREYVVGFERYELGFPKGRVEAGETFVEAANRELKEEVGMGARYLEHLGAFSLAPGYLQHETQIILASDLYPEKLAGDEPEPLEVVPWPLDQAFELLQSGECSEARSLAALYYVRDVLTRQRF